MAAENKKPTPQTQENPLGKILYEEELGHYLKGFIDPDTPTAPQNLDEVIDRVTGIWQENGFLQPHDLTAKMLDSCLPDCQPKVRELVREMLECQSTPDPLTGFARKEATPLLTGLAHLYGVQTDHPITMIEGDFGNMGGTNEHYRKLLAAERGLNVADVDLEESFPYTDIAARCVARLAANAFLEHLEENNISGGTFAAVRSGGDEIRFIIAGVDQETADRILEEKVNTAVEDFTARAGLHDHPHTKDRSNRYRNGFGAAFAAVSLDGNVNPATAVKTADVHIGAHKMKLGYLRQGEVFEPKARHEQLKYIYQKNPALLPDGQTADQAADKDLAMLTEQAAERGSYFAEIKQMAGTTYANASQVSLERMPELSPYTIPPEHARGILEAARIVIEQDYGPFSSPVTDEDGLVMSFDDGTQKGKLFQTPEERREQKLIHALKDADITISPGEQKFLRMALEGLSPKDPPTGANMPKEMPEIASIFAHDTQKLAVAMSRRIQAGDETVIKAFEHAGIPPDDLRAHALCVCFHNLAGINERFGHHLADIVLNHMANDIIGASFADNGLGSSDYVLAHEGGARFMAVVKPMSYEADKPGADPDSTLSNVQIIGADTIAAVEDSVATRTQTFNDTEVNTFFFSAGDMAEQDFSYSIEGGDDAGPQTKTFSGVEDPKRRYSSGLDVNTASRQLVTMDASGHTLSGGYNLHLVRKDAEDKVEETRNAKKKVYETTQKVSSGVSRTWVKNATI